MTAPCAKHGTNDDEQRKDDRADREARDGIWKRDSVGTASVGPGHKRSDEHHRPECAVAAPLRAQTFEAGGPASAISRWRSEIVG